MKFVIDPVFRDYLPPQTPEERDRLTEKIKAEGCAPGSLVVGIVGDMPPVLIDGHNTVTICDTTKTKLCEPRLIHFSDREAVLSWIRRHQFARRNLTPEQRTHYIGEEVRSRIGKVVQHFDGHTSLETTKRDATNAVAEEAGVSRSTAERAVEFSEAVNKIGDADPEAKASILNGTGNATKADVIAAGRMKCERCERLNIDKTDCGSCAEAAAKALKKAKKKKAKAKASPKPDPAPAKEKPVPIVEPRKDKVGVVVHERTTQAFSLADSIGEMCRRLDAIAREIEEATKSAGGRMIHASIVQSIRSARKTLYAARATHVCPYCKGEGDCEGCKGEGWLTATYYDQAPAELRKAGADAVS